MRRWATPDGLLPFGLLAVAMALRWPTLEAPPYGDEGLHYWTARYLSGHWDAITDIHGGAAGGPRFLVLQRPLFYLLFFLPSQAGFDGFRLAAVVAGSALAPAAFAAVRAHGAGRVAAVGAGLACASVPQLVMWSHLGLMDALMTVFLLGALAARALHRPGWTLALGVAASWTKETAVFGLGLVLAFDLARALRRREATLLPLRLPPGVTALLGAVLLGALPVIAFAFTPRAAVGAMGDLAFTGFADRILATPYLLVVLLAGVVPPASRFLCCAALAGAALLAALTLTGRDVAAWYDVPVLALALCGAAVAADAWCRWGRDARPWRRLAGAGPAVAAVALVALVVLLPGAARAGLRPLTGDGGHDLLALWEYETEVRDADLQAATAPIPDDGSATVLVLDMYPGRLYVPLVETARTVHLDWSFARSLYPFDPAPLASVIEGEATWTLVEHNAHAMNEAVREVYADCVAGQAGGYTVLHGAACAGRAQALEDAWRARDPTF